MCAKLGARYERAESEWEELKEAGHEKHERRKHALLLLGNNGMLKDEMKNQSIAK